MGSATDNQYVPDYVSPPGETLLETIDSLGMSLGELAERTGNSSQTMAEIIDGKAAITAEMASQLERVLGVPASFWTSRETQYREWIACQEDQVQSRTPVFESHSERDACDETESRTRHRRSKEPPQTGCGVAA